MRRLLVLVLAWLTLPLPASAAIRIGYVDLRKALNAVEDGRYAKAKLKKKKLRYQRMLNKAQHDLKREKKAYDSRATILRGNAKRKARVALQKKFFKLQRMYTRLTRDLAKSEAKETRAIFRKMEGILQKIARENGLILMLEKTESSILYARPDMDFTSELIRRYNRKFGKGRKSARRRRRRRRRKRRKRKRRKRKRKR